MQTNPYNFTRPVTDPRKFFGRSWLVDKIVNGLTSGNACSYAIYGGRRSGKTSLMRMVERRLNDRLDNGLLPIVLPLYMDLQFDPPSSTADFFQRLIHRLIEWQSSVVGSLDSLPAIRPADPAPSFAEAFKELYHRAQPVVGSLRLALLVDESEHLHRPQWAYGLEDNLRALLSNVPGVSGHLGLVMTGGVDFYNDMAVKTEGSPLRNVLDEEILLSPCSETDMIQMASKPTEEKLPENAVYEVCQQAGGHFFLGQFILRYLWDEGLENVDAELVNEIAISFSEKRRDYESWVEAIGIDGVRVYQYLATNEGKHSRQKINATLKMNLLEIRRALDKLYFHNLICCDGNQYTYRGEMFRHWFAENMSISSDAETKDDVKLSQPHGPKYVINVQNGRGLVIGDEADVEQHIKDES
jgi:hypothetical protein